MDCFYFAFCFNLSCCTLLVSFICMNIHSNVKAVLIIVHSGLGGISSLHNSPSWNVQENDLIHRVYLPLQGILTSLLFKWSCISFDMMQLAKPTSKKNQKKNIASMWRSHEQEFNLSNLAPHYTSERSRSLQLDYKPPLRPTLTFLSYSLCAEQSL